MALARVGQEARLPCLRLRGLRPNTHNFAVLLSACLTLTFQACLALFMSGSVWRLLVQRFLLH